MITHKADTLKVPGATLYYEVYGSGPTLLMIHGGIGDAGFYSAVAPLLAKDFQVVTYDRRGNSRSPLDGPPTDLVVSEQSDDARRVLEAVGTEPAYVFGNSAGAVIALDLAARYPKLAKLVIAHEPPVVELLPDVDQHRAHTAEVLQTYYSEGVWPAMEKFLEAAGPIMDGPEDEQPDEELQQRFAGNIDYFLTRELSGIVRFVPDIASLRTNGANVVLAGGVDSRTAYPYKAGIAVAELLGAPFVELPGDHSGYLGKPVEFAERLRDVLTP